MRWLRRDVVAHERWGGSGEMWWLMRDVVAQERCSGSFLDVVGSLTA